MMHTSPFLLEKIVAQMFALRYNGAR